VKTHVLLALAGLATRARLVRWVLSIMLGLGCSVSSAQIEPNAGKWKLGCSRQATSCGFLRHQTKRPRGPR
jgi:hypothetical protein